MLEFNIRNQEISRIDNFSPAEKSVKYLIAKFNFKTEDWDGAIKRAIFKNVKSKEEKDAMLEDDSCIVPWEVLVGSSDIEVSVHGVIDTEDITTNVAVFNLNRTLKGGSASEEPSPTVYEQMLKEMQETKEIAQSVRDDADAGKFGGGTNITVDAELSEESKNAVENRAIAKEINSLKQKDESLDKEVIALRERNAELEETVEKLQIKTTTSPSPFHHITDSANCRVLDFGMEGKTEQYTGTITDESGNEITVPNPDYPQEIVNAGVYNEETGRYEHKCCVGNKNLWNKEFASDVNNWIIGGYAYIPIRVKKGEKVNISFSQILQSGHGFYACVTKVARNVNSAYYWLYHNSIGSDNCENKKITAEDDWIYICLSNIGNTLDTFMQYIGNDLQIEIGSSKTELLPHASQPFTLTSPVPLTKWDKLVKRDGVWGWSIYSEEIFLKDYSFYGNGNTFLQSDFLPFTYESTEGFCKYLQCRWMYSQHPSYCIRFDNQIWFYGVGFTTTEEINQWISDNDVSIIHKRKTEVAFHPLPEEEQELLNNLETYYGVTNVYNEQGCPMWLTYVNDTKLYVDQKLLEIQQAII
jgi:hypothetical protein